MIGIKIIIVMACAAGCGISLGCAGGKNAVGRSLPSAVRDGSEFGIEAEGKDVLARDSMAVRWYADGDFPRFMRRFERIDVSIVTSEGRKVDAYYFVSPDYLCVGTDRDFLRLPVTPRAAQRIADLLGCFLSTPKICDDVYRAARVKPEPMPMMCQREDFRTFVVHNYIIEGQRRERKGLIAGHKKDVVLAPQLAGKPDRIALYGWHTPDGKPIQPVYTGHAFRYVDYSHGFRLVRRDIWVDGRRMDYTQVLAHPEYWRVLTDRPDQQVTAYPAH